MLLSVLVDDFIFAPIGERGGIRPEAGERLELSEERSSLRTRVHSVPVESTHTRRSVCSAHRQAYPRHGSRRCSAREGRSRLCANSDAPVVVARHDHGVITDKVIDQMAKGEGARDGAVPRRSQASGARHASRNADCLAGPRRLPSSLWFSAGRSPTGNELGASAASKGRLRNPGQLALRTRSCRAPHGAAARFPHSASTLRGEDLARKRVYRVAGVIRNWLSDEESVRRHYFVQCVKCGNAEDRNVRSEACPLCGHPTVEAERFLIEAGVARRGSRGRKKEAPIPSFSDARPIREFLQPSAFAVKLGVPPRRLRGQELATLPPARVTISYSGAGQPVDVLPGSLTVSFLRGARLFARSRVGARWVATDMDMRSADGAVSRSPGRLGAVSAARVSKTQAPARMKPCEHPEQVWRHAVLGTSIIVDAFRIRLLGTLAPKLGRDGDSFALTLAALFAQVAARRIGSIHACSRPWCRASASTIKPRYRAPRSAPVGAIRGSELWHPECALTQRARAATGDHPTYRRWR